MCVDERCTIVTSGARLPQRRADVVRGVVRADDDAPLALVRVGPGVLAGVVLVAPEDVHARDLGHVRLAGHARRQTSCFGRSVTSAPSRSTTRRHSPASSSYVARLRLRRAPVVELHDPGVHLEPVADLVLRREHRPVLGELEVRHVVVPDRVVQAERLVALAPGVAGRSLRSTMIVGTPSWRSRAPRAMPPCPPPTMTTSGCASWPSSRASRSRTSSQLRRSGSRAVLGAARAVVALGLLVALELAERGEQRPRLAVAQAQDARARGRPRSRTRSTPP